MSDSQCKDDPTHHAKTTDPKDRPLPPHPLNVTNLDDVALVRLPHIADASMVAKRDAVLRSASNSAGSSSGSSSGSRMNSLARPPHSHSQPSILKQPSRYMSRSPERASSSLTLTSPTTGARRGRSRRRAGQDTSEDDIYGPSNSRHKGSLERKKSQPLPPLPPPPHLSLPSAEIPRTPQPFNPQAFSTPATYFTSLSPAPPPTASLPPISRRQTPEFSSRTIPVNNYQGRTGSLRSSGHDAGTLEPTPYSTVSRQETTLGRRPSIGPELILSEGSRPLAGHGSSIQRANAELGIGSLTRFPRDDGDVTATGTGTAIDWIVPVNQKTTTVSDRLQPTLRTARKEKRKSSRKGLFTTYALNIAIGLQILLGAFTTGLSVVIEGKKTATMTAILGGITTIVASYVARVRGSAEPEKSLMRAKDLEQFIREAEIFEMDYGHVFIRRDIGTGDIQNRGQAQLDEKIREFRVRLEEILGHQDGDAYRTVSMFGGVALVDAHKDGGTVMGRRDVEKQP